MKIRLNSLFVQKGCLLLLLVYALSGCFEGMGPKPDYSQSEWLSIRGYKSKGYQPSAIIA